MFHLRKLEGFCSVVVYKYSCRVKLHIICICSNGLWAVRSDVRKHFVNTNRYNTQNTSQTPHVSLKRTINKQTACSTVLLEKPTAPQPVSKYEPEKSIAMCTIAQHNSWCGQPAEWGYDKTVKDPKGSGGR